MKKIIYILFLWLFAFNAQAQLKEYMHVYDIDLQESIPYVWRLEEEYKRENSLYDRKYDYGWRIPTVFNSDFRQKIKTFATVEKRFDSQDEEAILKEIRRMPKSFYPYIGPMLHNMRGLSGKVLDIPGIKETKNKFPDKIASHLQNIPDIEFVSPELYIFLSPQFWGEDMESIEFPKEIAEDNSDNIPNIRIDPNFILKVKSKINISDYYPGSAPKSPNMGIRHYTADKNTPLSSSDVQAFLNTFDTLEKFNKNNANEIKLIMIDPIINYWDSKKGEDIEVSILKGVVNPCQTIVRKVKWSGLRSQFQDAISNEAFGLDDWAYTCDKVIKAYRIATMKQAHIAIIKALRSGDLYRRLDKLPFSEQERKQHRNFMEAVLHMYDSKSQDVEAVKPFIRQISEKLLNMDYMFAGTPFIVP